MNTYTAILLSATILVGCGPSDTSAATSTSAASTGAGGSMSSVSSAGTGGASSSSSSTGGGGGAAPVCDPSYPVCLPGSSQVCGPDEPGGFLTPCCIEPGIAPVKVCASSAGIILRTCSGLDCNMCTVDVKGALTCCDPQCGCAAVDLCASMFPTQHTPLCDQSGSPGMGCSLANPGASMPVWCCDGP